MLTDDEIIKMAADTKTGEPGLHGYILPISFAREIERAVLAKAGEQEADLYIVYSGVCISGLYYDAESAKAYADGKQKEHSLCGSIASFHIKEMYCRPLPAQAIPEGWREIVEAVAHVGVDFGYGAYEIEPEKIDKARELLSASPKP